MAISAATAVTKTGQSTASARQFQAMFDRVISVRGTLDHNSLGAGLSAAGVYTVNGAAFGDFVLVSFLTDVGDDMFLTGQVTAANEVTVILTDGSAATNTSANAAAAINILVLGVNATHFTNAASY